MSRDLSRLEIGERGEVIGLVVHDLRKVLVDHGLNVADGLNCMAVLVGQVLQEFAEPEEWQGHIHTIAQLITEQAMWLDEREFPH